MPRMPILLSLNNKKILVIGAGKIATKRVKKLLDFSMNVTILASSICFDMEELIKKYHLKCIKSEYKKGDILGFDIVVNAVDNISLQEEIYYEAKDENILYNCVDIQEYCDFYFSSYIKEGDLTIAVSTNGTSPSFSLKLRKYIKSILPKDIKSFLEEMKDLRKTLPKGKKRMEEFRKKVDNYFDTNFKG